MSKRMNAVKRRVIERETSKTLVGLQPFLVMIACFLVGILFYGFWSQNPHLKLILLGLGIGVAILSVFTWIISRSRRDLGRVHSVMTMIMAGSWLVAATALGPFNHPLIDIWLLVGSILAGSWSLRTSIKPSERDDPIADFFKDNNLEGARLKFIEQTKNKVKGRIQLRRGKNTASDLQGIKGKLASLMGVAINNVRITPDPDNASKAEIVVVKGDALKQETLYDPNANDYESIADPLQIGIYEDREPALLPLQTRDLGASHLLIQGMNGSGKSMAAQIIFAEMFKRNDAVSWVIDTVKGSQTMNNVRPGIDWFIEDEATAAALFVKFKNLIKARADYLGKKDLDKWVKGCGLTFIHLHLEEASGLIANNPAFVKMMETARSTGIQISASLQRAHHGSVDTQARAQFSSVLCFGVADIGDASFALPDEVLDAGANPAVWRNARQGYAYLVAPGIDQSKWTTPLRTFKMEPELMKQLAKDAINPEVDEITLGALGDLYHSVPQEQEDIEEEDDDDTMTSAALDAEFNSKIDDSENEFEASIDDEPEVISDEDNFHFAPQNEVTPEEAKQILLDKIEELKSKGIRSFSAPDLKDVVVKIPRSRAWLHRQLGRMVEEGKLAEEDSLFLII